MEIELSPYREVDGEVCRPLQGTKDNIIKHSKIRTTYYSKINTWYGEKDSQRYQTLGKGEKI